MWKTVKLWGGAVLVGLIFYFMAQSRGLPEFAFLVGFLFVLIASNLEARVRTLWDRKVDKPRHEWTDDA